MSIGPRPPVTQLGIAIQPSYVCGRRLFFGRGRKVKAKFLRKDRSEKETGVSEDTPGGLFHSVTEESSPGHR